MCSNHETLSCRYIWFGWGRWLGRLLDEDLHGGNHGSPVGHGVQRERVTANRGSFENLPCGNDILRRGGSITHAGVFDRTAASRVNLLESFCYIADWQTRNIGNFKSFMLDSGAFTFAYGKGGLDNLDGYLDSYIEFIRENDISLFFELDIDALVGYEKVLGLRKRLEHDTGRQCIPVWHVNRGKDEWLRMCEEYPYVAVGGIAFAAGRKKVEPYLSWFTKTAHERDCKVHGLGYTNLTNLQSTGFDSVDSSAWLAGNKGGFVYVYRDGCMTKHEAPKGKKLDSRAAARHNFMEWVKYGEDLEGI